MSDRARDDANMAPLDEELSRRRRNRADSPPRLNLWGIPAEDPLIRFAFTRGGRYDRARLYHIPIGLALDIFPRLDLYGGRERFMRNGVFMIDHFCAQSLLESTPKDCFIDAYHFVLEHILGPRRPMFGELLRINAGRASPLDESCLEMLAISTLFSIPRGLGCDGWLLEDFAHALREMWQDGLESWDVDRKKWMFLANLEVFVDALQGESRGREESTLVTLRGIWGGLELETQRAVEAKIDADFRKREPLGMTLRIALDQLLASIGRLRYRGAPDDMWAGRDVRPGGDRGWGRGF